MKLEDLLDQVGEFTYMWGHRFFVETSLGNFLWSDPDYDGDNSIRQFHGSYKDACKFLDVSFGRDKGKHVVRAYCGDKIKLGQDIRP